LATGNPVLKKGVLTPQGNPFLGIKALPTFNPPQEANPIKPINQNPFFLTFQLNNWKLS